MLQALDLFGKNVILYFNGKTRSKTRVGGLFSLCFFGFIVWSAYHVSQDMIWHRNPKSVTSEFFDENPDEMTLKPDTFTFAFGVQDPDTFAHYIDESVYTVKVIKNQLRRVPKSDGTINMVWTSTTLATERCNLSHFGDLGPKFTDLELDQLFCFDHQQQDAGVLRIQGVFESPIYEYISVSLKECNETETTCASATRRKRLLEGGWFAVYYTNVATDARNYSHPAFKYRDSEFTTFGNNYFKETTMWLGHVEITSDLGWVVKEPEVRNFIKMDSFKETFNLRSDFTEFFRFVVRVGKILTHHDRSYIKIQDVLAEVNGLASIGILAAFIIVAPYSNLKFYEGLINELFDIKTLKKATKPKKKGNYSLSNTESQRKRKGIATAPDGEKTERGLQVESNPSSRRVSIDMSELTKRPLAFGGEDPDTERTRKGRDTRGEAREGEDHKENTKNKSLLGADNINVHSIELDEVKDEAASSKVYSVELSKHPFKTTAKTYHYHKDKPKNHEIEIRKMISEREFSNRGRSLQPLTYSTDDNLNRKLHTDRSIASPMRIKPKAVQPQFKLLDNYEANKETVEMMLETLIFEQQGKGRLDEIEKVPNSPSSPPDTPDIILKRKGYNEKVRKQDKGDDICSVEFNTKGISSPKHLSTGNEKDVTKINFTFWDYLKTYCYRTPQLKEKLSVLNEGKRRINERLDIFNVFKKLREVDKLKLLLLENEQLVLFDGLPKPELASKNFQGGDKSLSSSRILLKEPKFISERRRHDLIAISYENLRRKRKSTVIDQKLMEIFDDIMEG